MIRHAWSVVCEKAVVDPTNNNFVLFTLEQVKFTHSSEEVAEKILFHINGHIVTLWCRDSIDDPSEFDYRLRILDHKHSKVAGLEKRISFKDKLHTRAIANFDRMLVPFSGLYQYYFAIDIKTNTAWKKVAEIPFLFEVEHVPPATQQE